MPRFSGCSDMGRFSRLLVLSAIILSNHLMGETLGSKKWTRKLVIVTDAETSTDWNGWKEQRNKMRADGVVVSVV